MLAVGQAQAAMVCRDWTARGRSETASRMAPLDGSGAAWKMGQLRREKRRRHLLYAGREQSWEGLHGWSFAQSVQGRSLQSTVHTAPPSGADRTLVCAYGDDDWTWRFGRGGLSGKSIDAIKGLSHCHPCRRSWRRVPYGNGSRRVQRCYWWRGTGLMVDLSWWLTASVYLDEDDL